MVGRLLVACSSYSFGTLPGCSSSTTLTPSGGASTSTDVAGFASGAISQLYPIVLAVAGGCVALFVLVWGVNQVLGILHLSAAEDELAASVASSDYSPPEDLAAWVADGSISINGGLVDGSGSFS